MTSFDLVSAAQVWDMDYATRMTAAGVALDSVDQRRYSRILDILNTIAPIKYQPYQNDTVQHYVSKLRQWLWQLDEGDRAAGFLLASQVLFVTEPQFEALLRLQFTTKIRRSILNSVIRDRALPPFSYTEASRHFDEEMDKTLFIANSPSSHINSFTHINRDYFTNKAKRNLVGPPIEVFTYPQTRRRDDKTLTKQQDKALTDFENNVLSTDPLFLHKQRLVVLEDFSGSGSDLIATAKNLAASQLPFKEIILAPVIATSVATRAIEATIATLPPVRRYELTSAYELHDRFRCFDTPWAPARPSEPSYLDSVEPGLSAQVASLSSRLYNSEFASHLPEHATDGFGGLALAFVIYSNCPDNSLPLLWRPTPTFKPLFRRASKYL